MTVEYLISQNKKGRQLVFDLDKHTMINRTIIISINNIIKLYMIIFVNPYLYIKYPYETYIKRFKFR